MQICNDEAAHNRLIQNAPENRDPVKKMHASKLDSSKNRAVARSLSRRT
jgi:hypothetical protein